MEVTGQAFEDMQEQNMRLLQQLKEKDDANFKLMSEVRKIPHGRGKGNNVLFELKKETSWTCIRGEGRNFLSELKKGTSC